MRSGTQPLHLYLQRAHDALAASAGSLTLDQLCARRADGKWTIAEIVEHLSRAYGGTAEGARRVIEKGRTTARPADLAAMVRTFIVVGCGYLPSGREAPRMTRPAGADPATVVRTAVDNLARMDEALNAAAAAFGEGVKLMDHPILGPLTTKEWRKFHWIHTRHHVRQITESLRSVRWSDS